MKNLADVETRLRAELEQWLIQQFRHPYDTYYLYYLPTTAEHDGGFLFSREQPANSEFQLACPESAYRGTDVNGNMNRFRDVVHRLPVLALGR